MVIQLVPPPLYIVATDIEGYVKIKAKHPIYPYCKSIRHHVVNPKMVACIYKVNLPTLELMHTIIILAILYVMHCSLNLNSKL